VSEKKNNPAIAGSLLPVVLFWPALKNAGFNHAGGP
jgi:hypothetical protein